MRPSLFFFALFIFQVTSHASVDLQGHLRTGMVDGSFTGAATGTFNIVSTLELEGEFFFTSRTGILVKSTISLDQESGQFKYIYMGLGQRFYLFSRGRPIESYYEGVFSSHKPKLRFFVDYGVGLAQIQVRSLTESLSVQSTVVELGAGAGSIYQLSGDFGISFQAMWSKGFAVSSVAVDSTVIRAMLGVTGYF